MGLHEAFRDERKVRVAVRSSLAMIVRPVMAFLPVDQAFEVMETELASLRDWFEAQVQKQLDAQGKPDPTKWSGNIEKEKD